MYKNKSAHTTRNYIDPVQADGLGLGLLIHSTTDTDRWYLYMKAMCRENANANVYLICYR